MAEAECAKKAAAPEAPGLIQAIAWLVHFLQPISLFRLHKLLYLAEVECREVFGAPFLSIYYMRQKDGPFAPEVTRAVEFFRAHLFGEVRTADGIVHYSRGHLETEGLSFEQLQVLARYA